MDAEPTPRPRGERTIWWIQRLMGVAMAAFCLPFAAALFDMDVPLLPWWTLIVGVGGVWMGILEPFHTRWLERRSRAR